MVVESFLYIHTLLFDTTEKQNIYSWCFACKQHSFHGESMLPCKAFTWLSDHRTKFKNLAGLFIAKQQLLIDIYGQTKWSVILNLEWLNANWAILQTQLCHPQSSTRCNKIWDNFWITLLFILMSKLRYESDLPRQHMLQQLYAGSRAYLLLQVQYTEYIEFWALKQANM